jgi:hypothetical protein
MIKLFPSGSQSPAERSVDEGRATWVSPVTAYQRQLRAEALAMVPSPPPAPWHALVAIFAGGLIAVGWDQAEQLVLISHDGYSLQTPAGERLVRDRDTQRADDAFSATRLEWTIPETHEVVSVYGLHGGGGIARTADG